MTTIDLGRRLCEVQHTRAEQHSTGDAASGARVQRNAELPSKKTLVGTSSTSFVSESSFWDEKDGDISCVAVFTSQQ